MFKPFQSVKWGMIGCGDVTEVKSGPAFQKVKDSEIVAVMRRNAEKAKDYAKRHNIPKWYDDAESLIHDRDINAVYVATPPDTHAKYSIMALNAGKPVYVEKPMAINKEQCSSMLKALEDTGLPLFVAYYRRMLPEFLKAKELIEEKAIGDIRFVNVNLYLTMREDDLKKDDLPWRVLPEIAGGGYFYDMAPHQLDILDYIVGHVKHSYSHVANRARLYPAEDTIVADFEFENGALGAGVWCFTVDKSSQKDLIEIVGSKGTISFSCFDHKPVVLSTDKVEESFSFNRPVHIQQPLIETVVDALTGKGATPSDAISAARTNRVLEDILKPYYT